MKILVCLEVGPEATGAFVPEFPGCWVFGRTPVRALEKVRAEVERWFRWVKEHGEGVSVEVRGFEVETEILRVSYNPVMAGKPEPLFWAEVPPIGREDILRTIRLMRYSREDLLSLTSSLSDELLDWKPAGKPRTIRNCLRHIAYVEPWYISRLNVELNVRHPKNVFELLKHTREIVLDFLENFPEEKMRGIFQPIKDANPICSLWTARKVLRRLVDHERLHTRYVEKLLKMRQEIG